MTNWLIAVLIGIFTLFWYFKWKAGYWERRNVPHERSEVIVGNLADVVFGRKNLTDTYNSIYKKHKDLKYCGIMNFGSPAILLRDPELIKGILSKDQQIYHNCRNEDNGLVKDKRWKRAKAKITPQLTPIKVRNMFHLLQEITTRLIRYLENEPEANNCGLDARELSVKYASDIIGSCVFGLDADCFNNVTKPEFLQLGLEIFAYNSFFIVLNVIALLFPKLYKIKPPKTLSERLTANLKDLIISTVQIREEKKIKRHDFLGAIVELRILTKDFDFSLETLTFRSLGFFLDGFEISVVTFQHILHELAINKTVQDKLLNQFEIMLLRNGNLTYDALKEVKYLDMVICETLRKYPATPFLAKECENLVLPPAKSGLPELQVEEGIKILIPIASLHNDPSYFEEPEKFIPERFNDEAKCFKDKVAFVGFADGPRICLGHRFALTQLKIAVFAIVKNFEIQLGEPSQQNAFVEPIRFVHEVKSNHRLKLISRLKNKRNGIYTFYR